MKEVSMGEIDTKNIFLLLGGNILNLGIYNKFKNKGYLVYVVDWNKSPMIVGDKHYQIDVKDSESIIKALKKDNVLNKIFFAYSSIDLAVSSVAKINREVGLRTISDEALCFASSKSKMTEKWNKDNLLNRFSSKYDHFDDSILELNRKFIIIIKPDNSASSRGITILDKNSSRIAINSAFNKALGEASNNLVVVEEFVIGTEFTVEMIGDSYGNVSVYGISKKTHTSNTINNKIAVKLHYNSISIQLQRKIAEYGIRCYKSLGFTASFGHLEVLVKDNGVISPVEIGARSSGFIASDLVDIVSGEDFLFDLIRVQQGAKISEGLHNQSALSSMYFFYDFPSNTSIVEEKNLLDFVSNEVISRYNNRENLRVGKTFSNIDNDNARIGFEILEGPKSIMTEDYISLKEKEMVDRILRVG